MKAVGYIRVSTEEQRLSPDAQREDIERWCTHYDVELVDTFSDIGRSGALPPEERDGLGDAIAAVVEHGADVLVASRRDRIARDHDLVAVISYELRKNGARVCSTDRDPRRNDPGFQIIDAMQDAMAEMERDLLIARVRDAMAQKKEKGELVGAVPYGFKLDKDGKTLRRYDREQRAIQMVRRMNANGDSLRKIGRALAKAGYEPRGKAWHPNTVRRLING